MPRGKKGQVTRVLVGHIPVFTKKLVIADPSVFEDFVLDKRRPGKRKKDFSFSGACAGAELKQLPASELTGDDDAPIAIVTAAPKNQYFPVYALVKDGKVVRLVVVFDEDPCKERGASKDTKKRRRRGDSN